MLQWRNQAGNITGRIILKKKFPGPVGRACSEAPLSITHHSRLRPWLRGPIQQAELAEAAHGIFFIREYLKYGIQPGDLN